MSYPDINAVSTSLICISIVQRCFPKWNMLLFLVTAMNHALEVQKGALEKGTLDHRIQRILGVPGV